MKDTYTREEVIEILVECDDAIQQYLYGNYNTGAAMHGKIHHDVQSHRVYPMLHIGQVPSNCKKIREIFEK